MKYRCIFGHEIDAKDGTWTTLEVTSIDAAGATKTAGYNFCMHCFGAWAVRQFPLSETPDAGGP